MSLWTKSYGVTIQMKPLNLYFHIVILVFKFYKKWNLGFFIEFCLWSHLAVKSLFSLKSDQHQFSPNNIHMSWREKVWEITKWTTKSLQGWCSWKNHLYSHLLKLLSVPNNLFFRNSYHFNQYFCHSKWVLSLSFPSVKHKIITADGCHHYNYSTLALLKITHVFFLFSFGLKKKGVFIVECVLSLSS